MEILKSGFILYTINYKECVFFYENILKLDVLYRKDSLTCFDFNGSYLMVEIDDESNLTEPSIAKRDKTCLRMNVKNVKKACEILDKNAIPYDYHEFDWGIIAKFRDPDGNLIGFRSTQEHEEDIKAFTN